MPVATVRTDEFEKYNLKTVEGGWVDLRRLTYGEKLKRRSMTGSMTMRSERGKRDFEAEMQLINEAASAFDFAHCVVDHNLEDETGRKLNFASRQDLQRLDPRVGDEIETLMDGLNNFESEAEEGN